MDDKDVRLQRASADLIVDLNRSFVKSLWQVDKLGIPRLRESLRIRELDRLVNLLEPFQEDPQLLDPHLRDMLGALTGAYLQDSLDSAKPIPHDISNKVPLKHAICKLLYTFCKVRGDKIIVRFFPTETRYLEPLISALENASAISPDTSGRQWSWEERYVTLLWLSHLHLLPFDLASISSVGDASRPDIEHLIWPSEMPRIAVRAVSLAINYLESAGKERDAAKALLVRISIRHDMQQIGLLGALINWALSSLRSPIEHASAYYSIGILSYLAGVLTSSSSTSDMDIYLERIYSCVTTVAETQTSSDSRLVASSVVAKKNTIKILRAIAVLELRSSRSSSDRAESITTIIEETIQYLIEALADNDTPVRIAASKALSVITLKLAPGLVEQIVEAIVESLEVNVLWNLKGKDGRQIRTRDLSAVKPLQWHGLILTVSQLLYRRAPPPSTLASILHTLLIGLSFDVRATSGASIGSNVRDAACFGIWALARQYTTKELQNIDRSSVIIAEHHSKESSILQVLASELVVAATLDPAGNIRRGASAALQELIGRHPDTIDNGIAIVQTVDYHKIALRSKALHIGVAAASLSEHNAVAVLNGLLGWRGVADSDASTRKVVAHCVAAVTGDREPSQLSRKRLLPQIQRSISSTERREVAQRHGLILCVAEILYSLDVSDRQSHHTRHEQITTMTNDRNNDDHTKSIIECALKTVEDLLSDTIIAPSKAPHLIVEAMCQVITASCALIRRLRAENRDSDPTQNRTLQLCTGLLESWLPISEASVQSVSTQAACILVQTITGADLIGLIEQWLSHITTNIASNLSSRSGPLFALCMSYEYAQPQQRAKICSFILENWTTKTDVDSRVILLKALSYGNLLRDNANGMVNIIKEGLDDYTTDNRGDVGSWVRLQAIVSAELCFQFELMHNKGAVDQLRDRIIRLAAEKFDKVRPEAARAFSRYTIRGESTSSSRRIHALTDTSSLQYFQNLITMTMALSDASAGPLSSLLTGLISSAHAGSESLIRTTRQALVGLCKQNNNEMNGSIVSTLVNILKENLLHDRIAVPALEIIDYLLDEGIVQHSGINFTTLFILVQKAHFKSGNIRKLEAAIRIYGGLLEIFEPDSINQKKVLAKLVGMLLHPILVIRNAVVDVLFLWNEFGGGVDWGKVKKGAVELESLKKDLGV